MKKTITKHPYIVTILLSLIISLGLCYAFLGCGPINTCHVQAVKTWNMLPATIWKKALHYDGAYGLSHVVIIYESPKGSIYVKDGDSGSYYIGRGDEIKRMSPLAIALLWDNRAQSAFFDLAF